MIFRSYLKYRRFKQHTGGVSYTPPQIAQLYAFPKGYDGTGQKIGYVELGGDFQQADLDAYFKTLGRAPKSPIAKLVAGGVRASDPGGADGEVMLDLEIGMSIAPGAEHIVYFAPNTEAGFAAAIQEAVKDQVTCLSISWGAAEDQWTQEGLAAMESAFSAASRAGITVTVAAGDNGSGDGEPGQHVDYPASSLFVLGCGGTSLPTAALASEVVWNDGSQGGATGGGVSAVFALPAWQKSANVPGSQHRGVPDCAGLADPETGWNVLIGGSWTVVGGTSAVAPLMAAYFALVAQALKKPVGFVNDKLYSLPLGCLRDITSGNNGTYVARPGYDDCTGLGVVVGDKLLRALTPPVPVPAPPPPPPAPAPPGGSLHATRTIVIQGASSVTVDGKPV